jgi:hypothetical protein
MERSAMSTDKAIAGILDRMDRQARLSRAALFGSVAVEALLLVLVLLLTDWSDSIQRLLVIIGILGYSIVGLGLAALAAHVSRVGTRIVAALAPRERT